MVGCGLTIEKGNLTALSIRKGMTLPYGASVAAPEGAPRRDIEFGIDGVFAFELIAHLALHCMIKLLCSLCHTAFQIIRTCVSKNIVQDVCNGGSGVNGSGNSGVSCGGGGAWLSQLGHLAVRPEIMHALTHVRIWVLVFLKEMGVLMTD